MLNDNPTTPDHILKNQQQITHIIHRHEPPVIATDIKILFENEEHVVIDKPGTIPVHPSGRYRHNSIVFLLAKQKKMNRLFVVHRLDRLTSGILILAKSSQKATELSRMIINGEVKKKYIARVNGNFPQ